MQLIMIKKKGCIPCREFEPIVKKIANESKLDFKTVQQENMPDKIKPPYFPYFYLYDSKKVVDEWGGTSERKLTSVLKRNQSKS